MVLTEHEHGLLKKYMKLVHDFEGTTLFLCASKEQFTEGELLELQKLDQEIQCLEVLDEKI
jgi:hypothetical protein